MKGSESIQELLERSVQDAVSIENLLPGMLASAAARQGLIIPESEINSVSSAVLKAKRDSASILELDIDLPCAMGITEAQVQATIQLLLDDLTKFIPEEQKMWIDAISEAIPEALKAVALCLDDEIMKDALAHARELGKEHSNRVKEVQDLWGPAFADLDLMRHLVLEWSSNAIALKKGPYSKRYTSHALERIISRIYEVVGEILVLTRAGYGDGALARWRSLHEICVVAMFLSQQADSCAEMYLWHHKIEELKIRDEGLAVPGAQSSSRKQQYAQDLHGKKASLLSRFGDAFAGDYGWAAVQLARPKVTFRHLEEQVELEKLRRAYKRANSVVHGGSLATLTRVSIGAQDVDKSDLPPAYGCELAIDYATASLAMLIADLCMDTEDADLLTMNMVIQQSGARIQSFIDGRIGEISGSTPRAKLLMRKAIQKATIRGRPKFRR